MGMFADLDRRVAEWEGGEVIDSCVPVKEASQGAPRPSLNLRSVAARLLLRSLAADHDEKVAQSDAESQAEGSQVVEKGHWLVVDSISIAEDVVVPGLGPDDGNRGDEELQLYVAVAFDGETYRTATIPFDLDSRCTLNFGTEVALFAYHGQTEVGLQVRRRRLNQSSRCLSDLLVEDLYRDDLLIGELTFPLGEELKDCNPRLLQLPLNHGEHHAGKVSMRLFLRETDDPEALQRRASDDSLQKRESTGSGFAGVVSAVGSAVGVAVGSVEGPAMGASLQKRSGFGTCERDESSVIIVTEEGTGWCYYYPYATREDADKYFRARSWRISSRIMYNCTHGLIYEEVCRGGPSWAWGTISRAAWTLGDQTVDPSGVSQAIPKSDSKSP